MIALHKGAGSFKDETYDERVANHFEDLLFVLNMVDVLALDDIVLLHGFESKPLGLVLLQTCQLHISKGT